MLHRGLEYGVNLGRCSGCQRAENSRRMGHGSRVRRARRVANGWQAFPSDVVLGSSVGFGKVTIMKDSTFAALASANVPSHELRFASLYNPGRGISVPCDESGKVDLDLLTERLRVAYFGARAMVGREYALPKVQRVH